MGKLVYLTPGQAKQATEQVKSVFGEWFDTGKEPGHLWPVEHNPRLKKPLIEKLMPWIIITFILLVIAAGNLIAFEIIS